MKNRAQASDTRDHGGDLDRAVARYGGTRAGWSDLSTGINPFPYPIPDLPHESWTALPDQGALDQLITAARSFWHVPDGAGILPVPGASAAIALIPLLAPPGRVHIPGPTYNEHSASFTSAGWSLAPDATATDASVHVHPNNPDGTRWQHSDITGQLRIIDESFCDVMPERTLIDAATTPGTLILKSFGKFWGLAGLRLGFVIGDPALLAHLSRLLGPWAVAGPALHIGRAALQDNTWATQTREQLAAQSTRLDTLMTAKSAALVGGTPLFRLYRVDRAADWQDRLARHHIWSRVFPYNQTWLRLGLPDAAGWHRIQDALA